MRITGKIVVFVVMLVGFYAMTSTAVGQAKSSPPKTIFRDSDGDLISNNEFVDIRMANFHYPDATRVTTLADGSTEFWLQKIPQEGMTAPVVSVKTIDGKSLRLSDLRGKVVVLNFWFIGCPVCRCLLYTSPSPRD